MRKPVVLVAIVGAAFLGLSARGGDAPFSFRQEGGKYWVTSDGAPVNEVLRAVSEGSGIPIGLDAGDTGTVTVDLQGVGFEDLVNAVSRGHAIIYAQDPETGEYRPEKVVAAGEGVAEASAAGGLDMAAVVKRIVERATAVKQLHQRTEMTMPMMGNQMRISGEIWQKGNKMRMEMTTPPMNVKQITVADGDLTQTYTPTMNMVQQINLAKIRAELGPEFAGGPQNPGTSPNMNPLEGMDPNTLKLLGSDTVAGEKVYVLEGAIKLPDERMKAMMPMVPSSATFWISTKDGLTRKVVMRGENGAEMLAQEFRDVTVNEEIADSQLALDLPEGVQVVDMTDSVIGMYQAMKSGVEADPVPAVQP